MKIGRNDPCPCGSGKKYKKCCLGDSLSAVIEVKKLDDLSNCVLDLIEEKRFKEAEECCGELLTVYPEAVDGLERSALLYEAWGYSKKAAEFYQKTADFAQKNDGFDPEFIKYAQNKVKELGA